MHPLPHITVYTNFQTDPNQWTASLLEKTPPKGFEFLKQKTGCVFSPKTLAKFIDKEERHGLRVLTTPNRQPLKTMSSGEQKKALLAHLLQLSPDFMVLVNPYDNLDKETTAQIRQDFHELAKTTILIQVISRITDVFNFSTQHYQLDNTGLQPLASLTALQQHVASKKQKEVPSIPEPLTITLPPTQELISFHNVSVNFESKKILHQINWKVRHGHFWHLVGPNGSGKSTLLQMVTGDSHKAYGQKVFLFGRKKGTGESVWDIKKHIGYFTAAMTTTFKGYDNLTNMLIAGLHDAIGLYIKPTEREKKLAEAWLQTIGLYNKRQHQFRQLTEGEKRLLMTARAMIKHPPLLILDEPAIGLDDKQANLLVNLINTYALKSKSAIIYVSHQKEKELKPAYTLQLTPSHQGATAAVIAH